MDSIGVADRVERILAVRDDPSATDDLVESGLVAVREIQSWAEAQQAALVAKLSTDGFAEARVANAAKTSFGAASKSTQRAHLRGRFDPVTGVRLASKLATAVEALFAEQVTKGCPEDPLRGVYRGCAIPGCSVAYDRCTLHHLIWWRNGGATDLDNLLPLCTNHHGKIHHDGWIIELGANRELTLRLPDGTVHNTGPPGRRTAA